MTTEFFRNVEICQKTKSNICVCKCNVLWHVWNGIHVKTSFGSLGSLFICFMEIFLKPSFFPLFSSAPPAVHHAKVQNRHKCCIRYNGSKTIWISMGLVTIFGFLFNISRWFEIRVVPKKVSFNI